MNKSIICLAFSACIAVPAECFAQDGEGSLDEVLSAVEAGSPRLQVAAAQLKLDNSENALGRMLEDPELEFNYLWGQNTEVGNRHDLRITQSVDFATLSGQRRRLAGSLDRQAALRYKAERIAVMGEARSLCARLAYYNALVASLEEYRSDVEALQKATTAKEGYGEATVFDTGKARLQLAAVSSRLRKAQAERSAALSELRALCGNPAVDYTSTVYPSSSMAVDFDTWYASAARTNPVLEYISSQIESQKVQLGIDKAAWAPKLNVGYMDEIGLTDKYRGITVGISVPLWRNSGKVRSTTASINLASASRTLAEKEFYNRVHAAWLRADELRAAAVDSRAALSAADNRPLLYEAVRKGELSILDYILEIGLYYDALEETLGTELDWHLALADLQIYSE